MIRATRYEFQVDKYCLTILRPFLFFSIFRKRGLIWSAKYLRPIKIFIDKTYNN